MFMVLNEKKSQDIKNKITDQLVFLENQNGLIDPELNARVTFGLLF